MKQTLATIVTRIFDPFIALTVLFILALTKSSLTTIAQVQWFVISGLMMIGIPLGLFLIALHTGKIKNWDITNRQERPKLFFILLLYEILCLYFVRSLIDAFLIHVFLTVIISFAGFSLVTLFWKISGHAFMNAIATGLIVHWFGWAWCPVLLIVPLVSWSRVVRGNHTVLQAVAGAIYGWVCVLLFI